MSEPTLVRLEQGDPGVAFCTQAAALWMIGRERAIAELAATSPTSVRSSARCGSRVSGRSGHRILLKRGSSRLAQQRQISRPVRTRQVAGGIVMAVRDINGYQSVDTFYFWWMGIRRGRF